jgi:predicted Holliday junction resolvase-like endonuclease
VLDSTVVLSALAGVLAVLTVVFALLYAKSRGKLTKEEVEKVVDQRLRQQLHTVKGQIGEQLAPHMMEFLSKYEAGDARFLGGKPVDYIVYKGYSRAYNTDDPIDEVVFVEVKTSDRGDRGPDKNEAKIRDAIRNKHVSYDTITIHTNLDEKTDRTR